MPLGIGKVFPLIGVEYAIGLLLEKLFHQPLSGVNVVARVL